MERRGYGGDAMRITISGSLDQGPSWTALQELVRSMIGDGRFTRISRLDGGVNYRDRGGVYAATFTPEEGDAAEVEIRVNKE